MQSRGNTVGAPGLAGVSSYIGLDLNLARSMRARGLGATYQLRSGKSRPMSELHFVTLDQELLANGARDPSST